MVRILLVMAMLVTSTTNIFSSEKKPSRAMLWVSYYKTHNLLMYEQAINVPLCEVNGESSFASTLDIKKALFLGQEPFDPNQYTVFAPGNDTEHAYIKINESDKGNILCFDAKH